MISAVLLAVGVVGAHYAYYAWPPDWERAWASYIGSHALLVLMSLLLLPVARRARLRLAVQLGVTACWLSVIESGQAVVCGVIGWGSTPKSDLCIEQVGYWPYAALAAIAAAFLIVRGRTT